MPLMPGGELERFEYLAAAATLAVLLVVGSWPFPSWLRDIVARDAPSMVIIAIGFIGGGALLALLHCRPALVVEPGRLRVVGRLRSVLLRREDVEHLWYRAPETPRETGALVVERKGREPLSLPPRPVLAEAVLRAFPDLPCGIDDLPPDNPLHERWRVASWLDTAILAATSWAVIALVHHLAPSLRVAVLGGLASLPVTWFLLVIGARLLLGRTLGERWLGLQPVGASERPFHHAWRRSSETGEARVSLWNAAQLPRVQHAVNEVSLTPVPAWLRLGAWLGSKGALLVFANIAVTGFFLGFAVMNDVVPPAPLEVQLSPVAERHVKLGEQWVALPAEWLDELDCLIEEDEDEVTVTCRGDGLLADCYWPRRAEALQDEPEVEGWRPKSMGLHRPFWKLLPWGAVLGHYQAATWRCRRSEHASVLVVEYPPRPGALSSCRAWLAARDGDARVGATIFTNDERHVRDLASVLRPVPAGDVEAP
ncbi:MAG: hypothetical protein AAF533_29785 [Acidobacteriota bacterium]